MTLSFWENLLAEVGVKFAMWEARMCFGNGLWEARIVWCGRHACNCFGCSMCSVDDLGISNSNYVPFSYKSPMLHR